MEVGFFGPYGWGGDRTVTSIYSRAEEVRAITSRGGVYLWTVLTPEGDELVWYVGQTSNFRKRFKEHQGEQSIGWYHVYDPDAFPRGEKTLLWDGVYGHRVEIDADFVSRFEELRPRVTRFMEILRFHLAPISPEQAGGMDRPEFLKRVEAGLAYHFYNQPGIVGEFQDGGVHYMENSSLRRQILENLSWPPPDATTEVVCRTDARIRCFPNIVIV